jgi:hypothetical protein
MNDVRLRLSTVLFITAIASAAAFAAGRSTSSATSVATHPSEPDHRAAESLPLTAAGGDDLPPGHPPTTSGDLPPGHPAIDPNAPSAPGAAASENATNLTWKVPTRWQVMPNTSSMRIATYRVPRASGDSADADVSVTQAGGAVSANVERWIGQFDAEGQKKAKQSTRRVAGFDVTIVEVEGTFGGGMSGGSEKGWALLGAIVATPGMPHFFKITGPAHTVASAKAELDTLLASLVAKAP